MSLATASNICCAWSRRASELICVAAGSCVAANASHSTRIAPISFRMNSDSLIRALDAKTQPLDRARESLNGAANAGGLNRRSPAFADYFRPPLLGRIDSFNGVRMEPREDGDQFSDLSDRNRSSAKS